MNKRTKDETYNESDKFSHKNMPDIAWNWDEADYVPEWHESIFSVMARYIPSQSKILEVGAGGSHTLGALAGRLKCRAYGIEPDKDGILKTKQLAAAESGEVEMICGDGFYLPFADDVFDVVYSLGLIEHFSFDKTKALVVEHQRVCKPDGLVIVAVPNYFNFPHTFRKFMLGSKYAYYPEKSYTPKQLRKILLEAGLDISAVDGVLPFWGVAMFSGGWRVTAALKRLRLYDKINHLNNANWRARIGYMTYAIAKNKAI